MRILPLLALLFPILLQAQTPIWTSAFKANTGGNATTTDFAKDDNNNTYLYGSYTNSVTFGSTKLTASSQDVYVVKMDDQGDVDWAISLGGTNFEIAYKMAVDDSMNVYVTGSFFGAFDDGNKTYTSGGSYDGFLVKINSAGKVQWTSIATGTSIQQGKAVEVDASGNVYWAGDYFGSSKIAGRSISAAGSSYDIWYAKLTNDGVPIRVNAYGGNSLESAVDIAVSGKIVYLTGTFFSSNFKIGNTTISTSGGTDVYLLRTDTAFKLSWLIKGGGSSNDAPYAIDAASDGSVFLTGNYISGFAMGGTSISGSWYDVFVVRIGANSKATYMQNVKGNSSFTQDILPYGIKGFSDGSVLVAGSFTNSLSIGTKSWTPSGNADAFVFSLNKNGAFGWLNQGGGNNIENVLGLEVDSLGYYYIGGFFGGNTKFGSNSLSGSGNRNNFVAKGTPPVTAPKYNGLINRYLYVDSTFSKSYAVKPATDAKYSIIKAPTGLTLDEDDATLTYTPAKSQIGKNWVVIQAENLGGKAKDSFIIEVIIPCKAQFFIPKNICLGSETSFKNGNDSIGPVDISWDFGDGTTENTDKPFNKTYNSAGKYPIKMVVTNFYGVKDSITDSITVNPVPVAKYTKVSACKNDSVRLNNNSSLASGKVISYKWYEDTLLVGNTENLRLWEPKLDTADFKLVIESDGGCKDSITKKIITTGIPKAGYSTFNACAGDDALFFDNSKIQNDTISQYAWDFGDGIKKTVNYPGITHRYKVGGTFKPRLTVTTTNGCTGTYSTTLVVYAKPTSAFTADDFCFGNSLELEDKSTTTVGSIVQRRWTTGDGKSYVKEKISHNYKSPGKYTVSLVTANDLGCTDTLTKEIIVAAKAKAYFSLKDVCYGGNVYLNDSSTNGSNDERLNTNWYQDENFIVDGTFGIAKVDSTITTIKLVVKTKAGCTDSLERTINPLQPIKANFKLTSACQGDTIQIIESFDKSALASIKWFGFGVDVFEKDSSWFAVYTQAKEYQLFGRTYANNGCEDSMLFSNFEVYNLPKSSFSFELDSNSRELNLTAEDQDGVTYAWDLGKGAEPTITSLPTISETYPINGTYTISLKTTTVNGCVSQSDSTFTIDLVNSIAEINNTLSFFPNPASSFITLCGTSEPNANWIIYNNLGTEVLRGKGQNINVENLTSGVYLISAGSNGNIQFGRFVKR